MNLSEIAGQFLGRWIGTKELYFTGPPTPDSVSASTLIIEPVADGKFYSFAYTWEFKGKSHEGFLLVGNENADSIATAAWVDSFHMSGKIMTSEGAVDADGTVDVHGFYEAPPGPDWGWRTALSFDAGKLSIVMHNISPEGEEVLAVNASYERT